MAKAGVLAMTRSLAVEWGPYGIRLNAIAPGPFPTAGAWERLMPTPEIARTFETRMPLGRPGEHGELADLRSEEHTSELQSLMRISYAVFCLTKKNINKLSQHTQQPHITLESNHHRT